jgi:hypothetical protein
VTLKTDDLIFLAMDSPDYAALPPDPARPGVRLDYTQPIASPHMRGVGMAPAASDSTDEPLSMVEAWRLHADHQTMMTQQQRDEQGERAYQRLRAMDAAATLAAAISVDELLSIVEAIRECQAS